MHEMMSYVYFLPSFCRNWVIPSALSCFWSKKCRLWWWFYCMVNFCWRSFYNVWFVNFCFPLHTANSLVFVFWGFEVPIFAACYHLLMSRLSWFTGLLVYHNMVSLGMEQTMRYSIVMQPVSVFLNLHPSCCIYGQLRSTYTSCVLAVPSIC